MSSGDAVALIGDLAWPTVALVVFVLLRKEIAGFIHVLQARAADKETDVKLTREGLELHARVAALEGSVETQEQASSVLSRAVVLPSGFSSAPSSGELPAALIELRDAYASINEPDLTRRIQLKSELAHSMGAVALICGVERSLLAAQNDEVFTLALAALVYAAPKPGDDELLLRAGEHIERLHVRYHIAVAFARLAEARELSPSLVPRVRALLESYRRGADELLLRRIERTLAQLAEERQKT